MKPWLWRFRSFLFLLFLLFLYFRFSRAEIERLRHIVDESERSFAFLRAQLAASTTSAFSSCSGVAVQLQHWDGTGNLILEVEERDGKKIKENYPQQEQEQEQEQKQKKKSQ